MRTQLAFRGHFVITPLCPEYLSGEVYRRGLLAEMMPQTQCIFCDYFEALDWDDDPVERLALNALGLQVVWKRQEEVDCNRQCRSCMLLSRSAGDSDGDDDSDDVFDDISHTDSIVVPDGDMMPIPNVQVPVDDSNTPVDWGIRREDVGSGPRRMVGGWSVRQEGVVHEERGLFGSHVVRGLFPRSIRGDGGWGRVRSWDPVPGAGDNPQGHGD